MAQASSAMDSTTTFVISWLDLGRFRERRDGKRCDRCRLFIAQGYACARSILRSLSSTLIV